MKTFLCFVLLTLAAQITFGQAPEATRDGSNIVGSWVGEWSSVRSGGRFEFDIVSFDNGRMTGRVNSEAQACTIGWTALSGKLVGEEIRATYTIGQPCGRVSVVFPFPSGDVIEGKWNSEYPGHGTFRLMKQRANSR